MDTESDYVDIKAELQKAVIAKLNSSDAESILINSNSLIDNGYWFYVTVEKIEFIIYICKRKKITDKYFYKAKAYLVTNRPITDDDVCLDEDSRGKEVQQSVLVKLGKFKV